MAVHNVCHIEFEVTDLERSRSFFEAMFGWKFESFGPEMMVFGDGEKHIGGLQKCESVSPGSSPSVWIEVEDVDASLEKASRVGGSVFREKSPIPRVGWSAQACDPDGNPVGLVQFERT